MNKLIFLFFLASVLNGQIVKSQSSIEFYNNTDKNIYASYAYYDNENSCWTSIGWYKIEPYKERELPLGDYIGKIYIHGHQSSLLTESKWGSGYSFCVDPDDAFKIRNADKISCSNRANFTEKIIKRGRNKWTFNP